MMTVELQNSEVIAEVEALMERFSLTADQVVERVMLEMGTWVPTEVLGDPPRENNKSER
jgi:hypothetical protein